MHPPRPIRPPSTLHLVVTPSKIATLFLAATLTAAAALNTVGTNPHTIRAIVWVGVLLAAFGALVLYIAYMALLSIRAQRPPIVPREVAVIPQLIEQAAATQTIALNEVLSTQTEVLTNQKIMIRSQRAHVDDVRRLEHTVRTACGGPDQPPSLPDPPQHSGRTGNTGANRIYLR